MLCNVLSECLRSESIRSAVALDMACAQCFTTAFLREGLPVFDEIGKIQVARKQTVTVGACVPPVGARTALPATDCQASVLCNIELRSAGQRLGSW